MGAGTLALALMCMAAGQVPDEAQHTNQRALRIPIRIEEAMRSELRELLLFASWDQGHTYQQVATVKPDKNEFIFEARNDGTCWLKVAFINRQGKQEPENLQQGPPDQKIIIDTMKPVLKAFTAQRQGDDVIVTWEILEDHFDPRGFRLEYQSKDTATSFPTAIQATPGLTGQARFRPTGTGALGVRLMVHDLAGNQSVGGADVSGSINAASYTQPGAPAPMPTGPAPAPLPPPAPPPSALNMTPGPMPPSVPMDSVKQLQPPPGKNSWAPSPGAVLESNERPIATSEAPPKPAPVPPPPQVASQATSATNIMAASVARKPLPPIQYVNHPEVTLKYALAKVGKSGVGTVDLWWSRDEGQSWELYAVDPHVRGSTQNGENERTVELPGEGVFGFILVVKSRAGRGKPPPRAGDAPEIRVEVDTTYPIAKLFPPGPDPDPQHAGALVLNWTAQDNNLTNNPIILEWAEKREGAWNPIAIDIQNTGRYSWQLPENLPVQVYLRLRVRDLAGNESVAVTPEPQLVDLSEPEGRLLDVTVTPRRP